MLEDKVGGDVDVAISSDKCLALWVWRAWIEIGMVAVLLNFYVIESQVIRKICIVEVMNKTNNEKFDPEVAMWVWYTS